MSAIFKWNFTCEFELRSFYRSNKFFEHQILFRRIETKSKDSLVAADISRYFSMQAKTFRKNCPRYVFFLSLRSLSCSVPARKQKRNQRQIFYMIRKRLEENKNERKRSFRGTAIVRMKHFHVVDRSGSTRVAGRIASPSRYFFFYALIASCHGTASIKSFRAASLQTNVACTWLPQRLKNPRATG